MSRQWKFRAVAIPIGILLCVLSILWPQTSAVAVALATIGLLYVTFEYVLVTQDNLDVTRKNLDLFRRQLQRQERVVLHFDLTIKDKALWLRVSNLGLSNFLLQTAHVKKPDKTTVTYEMHRVVQSGKTEQLGLPADLHKGEGFGTDLEITLEYLGLDGSGTTSPKCFNVFLGLRDEPVEIGEALDSFWYIHCPKCNFSAVINVHGLKSFEAADERSSHLVRDLSASCPDHQSEWLLTVEQVRAQQQERRNRERLN